MTHHAKPVDLHTLWLTVAAGAALGLGLATARSASSAALAVLIALACVGEWLEVRLGRLGSLTLRPVIAFVALPEHGLAGVLVVGLLSLLTVRIVSRNRELLALPKLLGIDAMAILVGGLAAAFFSDAPLRVALGTFGWNASVSAVGLTVYLVARLASDAIWFRASEGLTSAALLRNIAARAWPHVSTFLVLGIILQFVSGEFGLVILSLVVVIIVETYYPWKLLGEQEGVLLTSLQVMAQAVDLKDPYTSNHSQRVAEYAVRLARAMGLREDEVEKIRIGALMHDIGKIGISGRIIRKPGKLTPEEQALMRQHSSVSAEIIAPLEILGESADMVRHHHENWDGSGYPDGLVGDAIPLGSRVIFVADAFDALSTDRPYRKGTNKARAMEVIRRHAGTQFDPVVAETLERILDTL